MAGFIYKMDKLRVVVCLLVLQFIQCFEYTDYFYDVYKHFVRNSQQNLNETFFPQLSNNQINATRVPDDTYKWAARVIHSRSANIPYLCTAVCIEPRIFITAARCLVGKSTYYITILYNNIHLPCMASIVPTEQTKQLYDDIGFVITEDAVSLDRWHTIQLYNLPNRTDDNFQWFSSLGLAVGSIRHKVVGYAPTTNIPVHTHDVDTEFGLYELKVTVSPVICKRMLSKGLINGYNNVPCSHPCTYSEVTKQDEKCKSYIGVEGSAVINFNEGTLLGIVTWGARLSLYTLPVGFAVPNSVNYWQNLECAILIRDHKPDKEIALGYYQNICNKIEDS